MSKYQSVTTPDVQHDATNFLTEIFFLNKYGGLPPYPWRKGKPLAKEWGRIVSLLRKLIKTHKVSPEQIAWYLHTFTPPTMDPKSIGLMVWNLKKIKRLFRRLSLSYLCSLYTEKFKTTDQGYMSVQDDYTPEPLVTEQKEGTDLLSILKKLENEHGEKETDR